MPIIDRVLKLINLLNSRQYVTLEMIKKTCGVPERTAYRYLNVISEAHVPVYFDKNVRGYRLSRRVSQLAYTPTVSEVLLIVLSLKSFSENLNEEYRNDIKGLIEKILTHQPDPVEDMLPSMDAILSNNQSDSDLSNLLTSVLIRAAITCKKDPRIVVSDPSGFKRTLQVKNPSLWFRENWHLTEKTSLGQQCTDVSNILKVTID